MSAPARSPFVVSVELPEELREVSSDASEDLPARLRVLWLVELVRTRRVGVNRAARLAGMPLLDFYRELAKQGVAALDVEPAELEDELAASARASGSQQAS